MQSTQIRFHCPLLAVRSVIAAHFHDVDLVGGLFVAAAIALSAASIAAVGFAFWTKHRRPDSLHENSFHIESGRNL